MLKLELKRIFSKKINVFAIGLALILAVIFSGFAVTSNRYVDENGNASTGIMATRKLTDNRRAWKGTLTEDELGKVIEQNKNAVTQSSEENAIYGTTLQPIDDIRSFIISVLTPDSEYDESVLNQITEENIQEFYDTYHKNMETSVYKGYKQDKIEMRGDRAEMSDFPLYLNTVAGGLDRRDQTIGGFSFVVKIYAVPVVEIIG